MSSSKPESDLTRALARAVRYVRTGVRSTHDVRSYLVRHGVSSEAAGEVVQTLRQRGGLNDETCARLWAEQWARRGYAWSVIRHKLEAKGLGPAAIHQAEVGALNALKTIR